MKLYEVDNLIKIETVDSKLENGELIVQSPGFSWSFALCRLRDKNNKFYWSTHVMIRSGENWYLRNTNNGDLNYGLIQFDWGTFKIRITREYAKEGTPNTEIEKIIFYKI